jgi:hypothetical protein
MSFGVWKKALYNSVYPVSPLVHIEFMSNSFLTKSGHVPNLKVCSTYMY